MTTVAVRFFLKARRVWGLVSMMILYWVFELCLYNKKRHVFSHIFFYSWEQHYWWNSWHIGFLRYVQQFRSPYEKKYLYDTNFHLPQTASYIAYTVAVHRGRTSPFKHQIMVIVLSKVLKNLVVVYFRQPYQIRHSWSILSTKELS